MQRTHSIPIKNAPRVRSASASSKLAEAVARRGALIYPIFTLRARTGRPRRRGLKVVPTQPRVAEVDPALQPGVKLVGCPVHRGELHIRKRQSVRAVAENVQLIRHIVRFERKREQKRAEKQAERDAAE